MKRKAVDYTARNVQDFLDYAVSDASHSDDSFADVDSIVDTIADVIQHHEVTSLTAEDMERTLAQLLIAGIGIDRIGVSMVAQGLTMGFALGSSFPGWLERQRAAAAWPTEQVIATKPLRVRRKVVNQ
jgi:hypothetical protein